MKNINNLKAVIFDLGYSLTQIKDPKKGLSFNSQGELNMMMGLNDFSAKEAINNLEVKEIEKKIGKLSNPSKMPSYALGIPIQYCVTGSKLAKQEGTICNKCYAGKGCYIFPMVRAMYEKSIPDSSTP